MTAEQIIQDIQAIRYKGIRFLGMIERNNARNKELAFTLHQHGSMQPHEGGGASRPCKLFLAMNAVLDTATGKIQWNYIDADMQAKAEEILFDAQHRSSLHDKLVETFGIKNTLKIKHEEVINDNLATIGQS